MKVKICTETVLLAIIMHQSRAGIERLPQALVMRASWHIKAAWNQRTRTEDGLG